MHKKSPDRVKCNQGFVYSLSCCNCNSFPYLVKVMGIEPMSESISTAASPSAAYDFLFRFRQRP